MKPTSSFPPERPGPFRVEHLRPGDPYELSNGHAIVSEPAGRRHARRNLMGGAIIQADPAVEEAGVDVGFALDERTLRAPDVAVGNVPDEAGFATGAPALALEYVEEGRDEHDLESKIGQLLAAGTRLVWVVRLGGERRVEVHDGHGPVVVRRGGEELVAPGILRNPISIDALYDPATAHEHVLHNELQRRGYANLDAVRAEQARAAIRQVLAARCLAVDSAHEIALDGCRDLATLERWLRCAALAASSDEVFARPIP